jgi:DNA-binding response OmpR family regulator
MDGKVKGLFYGEAHRQGSRNASLDFHFTMPDHNNHVRAMAIAARILHIEQNLDEAFRFEQAARQVGGAAIHLCRHISEAKAYLQGAGHYSDRERFPFPGAIVMDLLLGPDSAVQFIAWLNENWEHSPIVFVLAAATSASQRSQAIEHGARLFDRPKTPESLRAVVRQIIRAARPAKPLARAAS